MTICVHEQAWFIIDLLRNSAAARVGSSRWLLVEELLRTRLLLCTFKHTLHISALLNEPTLVVTRFLAPKDLSLLHFVT